MNNQTTDVATVDRHQWATLQNSLFPGATDDAIRMVLSYCKARGLDPMKKPCHIVPMKVKLPNGKEQWRDVVFPGIYELRTTAQKTGDYMGQDDTEFGETIEMFGQEVPSTAKVTVHRWHDKSGQRVSFSATARFSEYCGTKVWDNVEKLNQRWSKAPFQMLEKCAEAAALRKAFPDELGGEMAAEEMDAASPPPAEPRGKPPTQKPQSTVIDGKAEPVTGDDNQQQPAGPRRCTSKQAALVRARLDESGIPERDFLRRFDVDDIDFLKMDQVDEALEWIKKSLES